MSLGTLNLVEDLLRDKNIIPYCYEEAVEDTVYWNEKLLTEFVNIMSLKDEHPNWNTGSREGFGIAQSANNIVLIRQGVEVAEQDSDTDYVVIPDRAVYCPAVFMGVGSYAVFSVHKGRSGFLYESIKKSFELHVPSGMWTVIPEQACFSVDGKEVAGILTGMFRTRFHTYSVELGFVYLIKNQEAYNIVFDGIPEYDHSGYGGIMDSYPQLDLKSFFDEIYTSLNSLTNEI